MSKKKYPVGYKFNKLTVLEYMGSMDKDKNNHCFYKCRCECGKTIYIRTQQINVQKSCGCELNLSKKNNCNFKRKYPDGYKFNKLTIVGYLGREKSKEKHSFYKCQCECGNIINIRTQQINVQKSCGCCTRLQHN